MFNISSCINTKGSQTASETLQFHEHSIVGDQYDLCNHRLSKSLPPVLIARPMLPDTYQLLSGELGFCIECCKERARNIEVEELL